MDNILELVVVDRNPLLVDNVPVLETNLIRRRVTVDPHLPVNAHNLLYLLLDRLVPASVDNLTLHDALPIYVVHDAVNKSDRIDARRWRIAPAVDIRLGRCFVVL